MTMYKRITFADFLDAFRHAGRENQFSYDAKKALFEHIENFEDETGEPVELDVIAICCVFQESSIDEIIEEYNIDMRGCEDDRRGAVESFLENRTVVIWSDDERILYQQF
jgi:hypothetical protein